MKLLKRKTLARLGIVAVAAIAIASLLSCVVHKNMKSPASSTLVTKATKIVVFPLKQNDYIHELDYWWLSNDHIAFTQRRGKELWAFHSDAAPEKFSKVFDFNNDFYFESDPYFIANEYIVALRHYYQNKRRLEIHFSKHDTLNISAAVFPDTDTISSQIFWEERQGQNYFLFNYEDYWISINLKSRKVQKSSHSERIGLLDKKSVSGKRLYIVGNKLQEGNYPRLSDEYRYQGGYQYLVTDLSNSILGQHFIPVPRRLNETLERPETPDSSIIYASPDYTKAAIVIFLNSSSPKGKMVEEIWVSGIDGTHQRLLGSLEAKDRATDPDRAYNVKWTPDSKRISFIHKGALYTIPAE